MSREEFERLLKRYQSKKCTESEERLISQWYDRISEGENLPKDQLNEIETGLWESISKKINFYEAPNKGLPAKRNGYSNFVKLGIAAALTLAVLANVYFFMHKNNNESSLTDLKTFGNIESETIKNTDSKVVKPVRLSDGSLVILQPNSEISIDRSFTSRIREVTLKGEAFFEIAKDANRPFLVHSRGLVTKVLGTSFNIKAKPGDRTIVVDVKTGKVAVYDGKTSETVYHLTPNQQAVYDLKSKKIRQQLQEDPQIIISEEEVNEMKFDDASVLVVFAAIEKAYGIELEYSNSAFATCTITTNITNEGLKEKLDIICKALGATYKIEGTRVSLVGKGCE